MKMKLLFVALSMVAIAWGADDAIEGFCSGELSAAFAVASADRQEESKQGLLQRHRDEVLAKLGAPAAWRGEETLKEANRLPYDEYLKFVGPYLAALEAKADWKDGKAKLITQMRVTIRAQAGSDATKKTLESEIDEKSIRPMSDYIELMKAQPESARPYFQSVLPAACGADALTPGGIAFKMNGRKAFAFCPGSLLRASVRLNGRKAQWGGAINLDGLMFTAFHELGHLLGADLSSPLRAMHSDLVTCLKRNQLPFERRYEDEVLADFWGAVTLVKALEARPKLSSQEKIDLVALNLAPLKNGSLFGAHHLPYGARQQLVLGEICRHLKQEPLTRTDCRLNLAE